ncbi:MAG: hypothetical protein VX249_06230 [Pseudomonadota bacterium]|nr:hypothetical protein [Pseudomonadota bacterium]
MSEPAVTSRRSVGRADVSPRGYICFNAIWPEGMRHGPGEYPGAFRRRPI